MLILVTFFKGNAVNEDKKWNNFEM